MSNSTNPPPEAAAALPAADPAYVAALAPFATHAPEVPEWFKRKEWSEKVMEPCSPPEGCTGTGWMHEVYKQRVESPMDHLTRWRMTYAAAMVDALAKVPPQP